MPVMNGATAPPELPTDPISDSDRMCIFHGIRRAKIWTAHVYTGPSKRPENATATESPITEGTNQMTSSRMSAWEGGD
jgi:hypothetical protein